MELSPSMVTVVWSVTPVPWLEMYGLPVVLGAVAFAILLILLGLVIRRLGVKRPWGVLVAVRVPPGEPKENYFLEQRSDGRGRVFVGRRRRSQIRLKHFSIEPRHAVFFAKKQKVTDPLTGKSSRKKVCLIRNLGKGIVEVAGVRLKEGQVSHSLHDSVPIRLGNYEFQWREE
jgi:hypothetical protein